MKIKVKALGNALLKRCVAFRSRHAFMHYNALQQMYFEVVFVDLRELGDNYIQVVKINVNGLVMLIPNMCVEWQLDNF